MAGTTAHGLPYPTGSDLIMDGDNAIQALAEAVDAAALREGDSGTLSPAAAGFTLAAGFTALGGIVRRRNGVVSVNLTFTITNALSAGDVANAACVNIPAGWTPLVRSGLTSASTGSGIFYSAETNGVIQLTATTVAVPAAAPSGASGLWLVA